MASEFKNLLIINRNSVFLEYLKRFNIYFEDEKKPFTYTNPNDKIILCLKENISPSGKIVSFTENKDLSLYDIANHVCMFKVYSDLNHLKVSTIAYKDFEMFKKACVLLKEYLIETVNDCVSSADDIDGSNFCLHWDEHLLDKDICDVLKKIGLLSDISYYYKFTCQNIKQFTENKDDILKHVSSAGTSLFSNIASPNFTQSPMFSTTFSAPSTLFTGSSIPTPQTTVQSTTNDSSNIFTASQNTNNTNKACTPSFSFTPFTAQSTPITPSFSFTPSLSMQQMSTTPSFGFRPSLSTQQYSTTPSCSFTTQQNSYGAPTSTQSNTFSPFSDQQNSSSTPTYSYSTSTASQQNMFSPSMNFSIGKK